MGMVRRTLYGEAKEPGPGAVLAPPVPVPPSSPEPPAETKRVGPAPPPGVIGEWKAGGPPAAPGRPDLWKHDLDYGNWQKQANTQRNAASKEGIGDHAEDVAKAMDRILARMPYEKHSKAGAWIRMLAPNLAKATLLEEVKGELLKWYWDATSANHNTAAEFLLWIYLCLDAKKETLDFKEALGGFNTILGQVIPVGSWVSAAGGGLLAGVSIKGSVMGAKAGGQYAARKALNPASEPSRPGFSKTPQSADLYSLLRVPRPQGRDLISRLMDRVTSPIDGLRAPDAGKQARTFCKYVLNLPYDDPDAPIILLEFGWAIGKRPSRAMGRQRLELLLLILREAAIA